MKQRRDMSQSTFMQRLKAYGFQLDMLGGWAVDKETGRMYGFVLDAKTFRIQRRESLSSVLKARDRDRKNAAGK